MHCFIQIKNNRFERTIALTAKQGAELAASVQNVKNVLEMHNRLLYVRDALAEFDAWSHHASTCGEMLRRNIRAAERFCRGFLLEFKIYLDHTQTMLSHTYGRNSEILRAFLDGTHQAYDNSPEYGFTYQLRNFSQHCENVVHALSPKPSFEQIRPTSISQKLLAEFDDWKATNREYMAQNETLDLLDVFKKTYDALKYVHTPVIQHMLSYDGVSADVMYLRNWADLLTEDHKVPQQEIWYWHFAEIVHQDGSEFTEEDLRANDSDREYCATLMDWSALLDLTDSMTPSNPT